MTEPDNLLSKGRQWMVNNNKVLVKYSITALDLSLLGLDPDDFEVYNFYPVKNRYLGIDDVARVVKKNIDICDETKSTIEIGESLKTLSELQREKLKAIEGINADIVEIRRNYATNQKLNSEITKTVSLIDQRAESIVLSVTGGTVDPEDYETFEQFAQAAYSASIGKYSAELEALTQWKGTTSESLATLQQTVGENSAALLMKASVNDINNALDLYGSGRNLLKNTSVPLTLEASQDSYYTDIDLTEALISDQVYTFSADIEILAGSPTAITIRVMGGTDGSRGTNLTIENGRISGEITGSNGANLLRIFAGGQGALVAGDKITFSKMKLEKGNRATAWSAAPEELATTEEVTAEISVKIEENNGNLISIINTAADVITLTSNRLSITSDKFTLTSEGAITCSDVDITGGTISIPIISGTSGSVIGYTEIASQGITCKGIGSVLTTHFDNGGISCKSSADNKYRSIGTGSNTLTLYWPEIYLLSENVYTWDSKYSAKRQGLTGLVDKSDYMLFVNGLLIEVGSSSGAFSGNPHVWLHD